MSNPYPQYTQQQPPPQQNPYPQQQGTYPMYPSPQPSTATVNNPPPQQYQPPPQQYQPPPQQYQSPPPQQYQQPQPQYQSPPPQQYIPPNAPTFHTYQTELYVTKTGVPGIYNIPQPSAPPMQKKSTGFSISGMLKAVESGINSVAHEIDKSLSKHYVDPKGADSRFRARFWLPQHEGLIWELPAKFATIDNVYAGQMYLSYNYFSVFIEFNGKKSAVLIPLRDVVAIQKAMIGRSVKESQPNIVPYNPNENKLQDQWVIEVYTNAGRVHQIFSVPDYDAVYNSIYTSWIQCNKQVQLPMPVQPAPTPQPQTNTVVYQQGPVVYQTTTTTTVIKK